MLLRVQIYISQWFLLSLEKRSPCCPVLRSFTAVDVPGEGSSCFIHSATSIGKGFLVISRSLMLLLVNCTAVGSPLL